MRTIIDYASPDTPIVLNGRQIWPAGVQQSWKLTLPIDAQGGNAGEAMEISPLVSDYYLLPYFDQRAGQMKFVAPASGATTDGSDYPRCELRELNAVGSLAAWYVDDGKTHTLKATCVIDELPVTDKGANGRVTIAQIHGPNDELCGLMSDGTFYDDKALSATPTTGKMQRFDLKAPSGSRLVLPTGIPFAYELKVTRAALTVSVMLGGVVYSAIDPISAFWPGKKLFFKAGAYSQVGRAGTGAGTIGQGRAAVTLSNLQVAHG